MTLYCPNCGHSLFQPTNLPLVDCFDCFNNRRKPFTWWNGIRVSDPVTQDYLERYPRLELGNNKEVLQ